MVFQTITATLDTGFTGMLALPSDVVQELGLTYHGNRTVRLAHGQQTLGIYGAAVSWFGQLRAVVVHEVAGTPLVGTALLANSLLTVDFRNGGDVIIQPQRRSPQPD